MQISFNCDKNPPQWMSFKTNRTKSVFQLCRPSELIFALSLFLSLSLSVCVSAQETKITPPKEELCTLKVEWLCDWSSVCVCVLVMFVESVVCGRLFLHTLYPISSTHLDLIRFVVFHTMKCKLTKYIVVDNFEMTTDKNPTTLLLSPLQCHKTTTTTTMKLKKNRKSASKK